MIVAARLLIGLLLAAGMAVQPAAQADPVIVTYDDGSSDLYECEEDSPPPCVWQCERMGNHICGPSAGKTAG